jgi:hypothetical protein
MQDIEKHFRSLITLRDLARHLKVNEAMLYRYASQNKFPILRNARGAAVSPMTAANIITLAVESGFAQPTDGITK